MASIDEDDLIWGVRRSVRYHNRRRMFFDRLNKFNLFLSALSGTAVIATVLGDSGSKSQIFFSAMVVIFSVADLVIGSPQMARLHSDLYRQFLELERDIVIAGEEIDSQQIRSFQAKRLEIEAKEPSVMTALNLMCHNELLMAEGYGPEFAVYIPPWKKLLAHFWSFDGLSSSQGLKPDSASC